MSQINPVKYSKELQKVLFPNNSFYKKSIGETGVADNVTSVERPVQGSIGKGKKGVPKTLPLAVKTALDSSDSYGVDLVYADPLLIQNPTDYALNYNKRATKQAQQASVIETKCADIAAVNWGPSVAAQILKSTGSVRASNVVGLTGNRKAIQKVDMLAVKNLLMRMNVDGQGGEMCMLATPDAYTDLLAIPEFVDYEKTGNSSKLAEGIIGRILGINIYYRSTEEGHTGLLYTNAATPVKKSTEDAIAATDRPANLFWNSNMVCRAEGKLKAIVNEEAPGYMGGTIIEAQVRFGASTARQDQKGVIALLEDNA
ncbi:hypothetical protein BZG01_00185 [Labilibaculum manganireducens]|uniref:Phage capsid protein n=1 Tax=Labilibaculum manganireducens TaxID=1940525 RepID=A0A2N3IGH9_9BACT|nr:hypothetical protein [Labilibaculum manganireducens]PKQ69391.1 hypothetical protein BZG01_00185 [Labilibaculum manganireducens]